MAMKKRSAVRKKAKRAVKSKAPAAAPAAVQVPLAASTSVTDVSSRIPAPAPEFHFGEGKTIFPEDRPVSGADIERLKNETGYDLNTIEASLGISRRDYYYELRDQVRDRPLPDISMAILMRLYETFPKRLLPFQPVSWAAYLQAIGVHPGEFAQLVGRAFTAGRSWMQGGKPIRAVQLIIEAFWRAGVADTSHPVYQQFLKIAEKEAALRGETREVKKAPAVRRNRRQNRLVEAEDSMLQPVDD